MYTSYYGMNNNPFLKEESTKHSYESNDYKEVLNRLNYLKEVKGIGVFSGTSGLGKTYTMRSFIDSLNQDLYKVFYITATPYMAVFDFLKIICDQLGIDIGACYRSDIYNNIQKEFIKMVNQYRIQPVVIIDDAHLLSRSILFNLKIFYDFEKDSKDYVSLILVGYPELRDELSKVVHETLKQRIIVNYSFEGLSREEVKEYVTSRLKIANTNEDIFEIDALNALYSCCKSSPRILNTLVLNSLMLGTQYKRPKIDAEIIMLAKGEMDLK